MVSTKCYGQVFMCYLWARQNRGIVTPKRRNWGIVRGHETVTLSPEGRGLPRAPPRRQKPPGLPGPTRAFRGSCGGAGHASVAQNICSPGATIEHMFGVCYGRSDVGLSPSRMLVRPSTLPCVASTHQNPSHTAKRVRLGVDKPLARRYARGIAEHGDDTSGRRARREHGTWDTRTHLHRLR